MSVSQIINPETGKIDTKYLDTGTTSSNIITEQQNQINILKTEINSLKNYINELKNFITVFKESVYIDNNGQEFNYNNLIS